VNEYEEVQCDPEEKDRSKCIGNITAHVTVIVQLHCWYYNSVICGMYFLSALFLGTEYGVGGCAKVIHGHNSLCNDTSLSRPELHQAGAMERR